MTGILDELPDDRHVQISFVSNDDRLTDLPESIYNISLSADIENLNTLVNKTIAAVKDNWKDKRFEFLVGETFIRSSLGEFIEEYNVETETVIKVECVLGKETPSPLHDLPAPDWVSSVKITPSHILATTYSGEATIFDKKGKKVIATARDKSAYKCCAMVNSADNAKSLDGFEFLIGAENTLVTLLHVDEMKANPKVVFRGHERSVECISVNKDKTRFISGAFDNHLKVWNLEESDTATIFDREYPEKSKRRKQDFVTKTPMVTLAGHRDVVASTCWAPWNPSHAISASWDQTIATWDLELAGEVSRIRGQRAYTCIDVNSSGHVISASTDAVPRLYDPRSTEGVVVKQSFIGHNGWVSAVKWSPTDERCFVSSSFDKSVKMWDIRSSKTSLFDLHGHSERALCVDWNNGLIASGSVDCTVKVFSAN